MKNLLITTAITIVIIFIVAYTGAWLMLILWATGVTLYNTVAQWVSLFSSSKSSTPTYTFKKVKSATFDRR